MFSSSTLRQRLSPSFLPTLTRAPAPAPAPAPASAPPPTTRSARTASSGRPALLHQTSSTRLFTFSRGFRCSSFPTPPSVHSAAPTLGTRLHRLSKLTKTSGFWGNYTIRRACAYRNHPVRLSINRGTQDPSYPSIELRASSNTLLVLFILGLAVSGALYIVQPFPRNLSEPQSSFPTPASSQISPLSDPTMSAELAPGRPGNLKPEEEAKLKEMWLMMHKVFGVKDPNAPETPAPAEEAPASPSVERRGSRFSIWGRKSSETPAKPNTAGGVDLTSIEKDDKFGLSKEFKDTLAELSNEQIREAFWKFTKHDHPDAILLRFLRARKWDVNAAFVMGVTAIRWRIKNFELDEKLMPEGEPREVELSKSDNKKEAKEGNDFLNQYRMGKSFIHGIDSENRPICYVRVRLHHGGEQGVPPLERYIVHTIETARFLLKPPVDTATLVFDMTGFTLANMDYTPVKFMIKCFEANYPESLGLILIHNAPWIFQGIWKIIKGWMDPVVASKVNFTNGVEGMSEYIPVSRIPKELGGDEDWTYEYIEPTAGENEKMKDTATRDSILAKRSELNKKFEEATLKWVHGDDAAQKDRNDIASQLVANYWELDPYVRARSLLDPPRTQVINPGGFPTWYKEDQEKATNGAAEKAPVTEAAPAAPVAA